MGKCKTCGCWLAPDWLIRTVEAVAIVLVMVGVILMMGCVTSTQLCVECGDYGLALNRTMDTGK